MSASTRLAITEVYARYTHAFDSAQAETCAELFTTDPTFTTHGGPSITGRAALTEFFGNAAARSPGMRLFVSNIVLDAVAADRVNDAADVMALRVDGDVLRLASMGNYRDEFACADGRWLIRSRYFRPAIPDGLSGAALAQPQH